MTNISRISSIVSFNGWVLAAKTLGTFASTSIAPEESSSFIDFAESVKEISLVLTTSSVIKSGLFKSSDKSFVSIVSLDSLLFPICLRVFSPGSSKGELLSKIWSEDASTQLFFLDNPMAGPKIGPSSFCKSDNFLEPPFSKFSNRLSGSPFWKDSMPFLPKLMMLVLDSLTIARSFSLSHSIPRLIWSGESFVFFSSVSGVCFGFSFREVIIFFSISWKTCDNSKSSKKTF